MSDVLVSFDFPPTIGGAHKWLYDIYSRWPTEVQVLTAEFSKNPDKLNEQRAFDKHAGKLLSIHRRAGVLPHFDALSLKYPPLLWKQVAAIKDLAGTRSSQRADIARIHVLRAVPEGIPAWLYCKLRSRTTRLITFVHGEEVLVSQTSRQLRILARQIYEDSHLVIANSENTQNVLREMFPNVRSICIHPGVDTHEFQVQDGNREHYRRRFGWSEEIVIVLILARMEPRKNHSMVIRAISRLRSEKLPIALVCGGDGPERRYLENLTRDLGLSEWVRFVGIVPEHEKPHIYAAADIFAMPSITAGVMIEGFGIVLVEAAAAGLPTVCGITGGQREAIWDGVSGYAVDGESVDDVTEAIGQLARNPELRRRFGDAGRKLAAEHDWGVVIQEVWEKIQNYSI